MVQVKIQFYGLKSYIKFQLVQVAIQIIVFYKKLIKKVILIVIIMEYIVSNQQQIKLLTNNIYNTINKCMLMLIIHKKVLQDIQQDKVKQEKKQKDKYISHKINHILIQNKFIKFYQLLKQTHQIKQIILLIIIIKLIFH